MSGAQRGRDDERERALIAMRDRVIAAVAAQDRGRRAGSAAVEDAVDEALAQMYAKSAHLGELDHVRGTWIAWARKRLIDDFRSAEVRHRAAVSVDDGVDSLQLSVGDDVTELSERALESWQIRELLGVVRGDARRWVEAYYDEIASGRLKPGAQPRGLHEVLGWSQAKTNKTAQRARAKMVTFAERRASGEVCDDLRELLDAFVVATSGGSARPKLDVELDRERFERVLFHTAGCASCRAAFRARRRGLRAHGALLGVPFDVLAGAWQGLGERLGGVAARLGLGGAGAATGGAAAISAKTATVCMGVLCAAGATGELTGVLPPVLPDHERPVKTTKVAGAPRPAPAPVLTPAARTVIRRVTAPPPPPPPAPKHRPGGASTVSTRTSFATSPRSSPTSTAHTTERFTPGDLPPASSASTPPPPIPAATRCVPGDLGC